LNSATKISSLQRSVPMFIVRCFQFLSNRAGADARATNYERGSALASLMKSGSFALVAMCEVVALEFGLGRAAEGQVLSELY
jgi:hypothetical protein